MLRRALRPKWKEKIGPHATMYHSRGWQLYYLPLSHRVIIVTRDSRCRKMAFSDPKQGTASSNQTRPLMDIWDLNAFSLALTRVGIDYHGVIHCKAISSPSSSSSAVMSSYRTLKWTADYGLTRRGRHTPQIVTGCWETNAMSVTPAILQDCVALSVSLGVSGAW